MYGPPQGPQYPQQPPQGYGYPQMPPPKKGMSGAAIVGIVIACMFGGCVVLGAIGKATQQTPAANAATAKPGNDNTDEEPTDNLPLVQAATLIADYKANEVRADQEWKGRRLRVQGTVKDIRKDAFDNIVVSVGGNERFEFQTVHATVQKKFESRAAGLSKGDTVEVAGKVDGLLIGSVIIRNAALL